ncbi:hypothetical protein [Aurantibacillus circumpalustris]|uniref:hypothetical protein n=1 Tax=Aurantibacillus circumpalustris TaxID=3036359 RepID=UPI00295A9E08|nr:hypothetical protein [Aurantibacillus circumpalustris]
MKKLLLIALICFSVKLNAQFLVSSNTAIEFCNERDSCLNANNFSFLFYDESKSEFFLKVDFSTFRTEQDTSNNWLINERDTCLYYRFIFPREDFPKLGIEERQSFKLNGKIFYNNKWKEQSIDLSMFAPQSNLMNNTSNPNSTGFENYKVNFTLPFVPANFKKYKIPAYNKQVVNINVTLGRINMLKQGMESILDADFYQTTR